MSDISNYLYMMDSIRDICSKSDSNNLRDQVKQAEKEAQKFNDPKYHDPDLNSLKKSHNNSLRDQVQQAEKPPDSSDDCDVYPVFVHDVREYYDPVDRTVKKATFLKSKDECGLLNVTIDDKGNVYLNGVPVASMPDPDIDGSYQLTNKREDYYDDRLKEMEEYRKELEEKNKYSNLKGSQLKYVKKSVSKNAEPDFDILHTTILIRYKNGEFRYIDLDGDSKPTENCTLRPIEYWSEVSFINRIRNWWNGLDKIKKEDIGAFLIAFGVSLIVGILIWVKFIVYHNG